LRRNPDCLTGSTLAFDGFKRVYANGKSLEARKKAGQQPGESLGAKSTASGAIVRRKSQRKRVQPRASVPALERLPHTCWERGLSRSQTRAFAIRRIL